jgi:hypothetical protein
MAATAVGSPTMDAPNATDEQRRPSSRSRLRRPALDLLDDVRTRGRSTRGGGSGQPVVLLGSEQRQRGRGRGGGGEQRLDLIVWISAAQDLT